MTDYYVTQNGGNGTMSLAEFSALHGDYSGSTFYFSGEFINVIETNVYGTSDAVVGFEADGNYVAIYNNTFYDAAMEIVTMENHEEPIEINIPENSIVKLVIKNSKNITIKNSTIYGSLKITDSNNFEVKHSQFYVPGCDTAISVTGNSHDAIVEGNLLTSDPQDMDPDFTTAYEIQQPKGGEVMYHPNLWTITNIFIIIAICIFTYKFILPRMNIRWFAKKFKEMIYKPFQKIKEEVKEEMENE